MASPRPALAAAVLLGATTVAIVGCARVEVEQGNYLTQSQVTKLSEGMSRGEVRRLLGEPLLQDPFHPDRWDYVFYRSLGGDRKVHRRLTLFFNGEDRVQRVVREGGDYPEAYSPDQGPDPGLPPPPDQAPDQSPAPGSPPGPDPSPEPDSPPAPGPSPGPSPSPRPGPSPG